MLNPNDVKPKVSNQDTQHKQKAVTNSDNLSIKDKIEEYSDERMTSGRINESHKRATFLVDEETLDKLQNLIDLMEATNAIDSYYQDNLTKKQIRSNRLLAKGFKSKFINFSLSTMLDEIENSEGTIPNVDKARYKTSDGTYNRAFRFKQDNVLYGMEQNNRGKEIKFMSTANGNTEQEINEWFESKLQSDEPIKNGAPRKNK